jgi:hypothetical protein
MSNMLVSAVTDVKLSVENVNGATIDAVLGGHPCATASWGVAASLGTIQYGQQRNVVFSMKLPAGQAPYVNVALQYADRNGVASRVEAVGVERAVADETSVAHWARGIACTAITDALDKAEKQTIAVAHAGVSEVSKTIHAQGKSSPHTVALLKDLDGQVLEALSKQEFYKRWGRHYLPSLRRAHQLQQVLCVVLFFVATAHPPSSSSSATTSRTRACKCMAAICFRSCATCQTLCS